MITTQLYFMPDVEVTCGACKGARFNAETLEVTVRGKTIDDVLNMSVEEGATFFASEPALARKIEVLNELGLGYLTLGQSSTTLSGGEAQRIKIATELSKLQRSKHTVYILDEPTTGLHLSDVERLLAALNRLVDAGHTVLLIEHHMDVIKTADHVIDLGPEGGHAGGEVVVAGTPEDGRQVQGVVHGTLPEGSPASPLASRFPLPACAARATSQPLSERRAACRRIANRAARTAASVCPQHPHRIQAHGAAAGNVAGAEGGEREDRQHSQHGERIERPAREDHARHELERDADQQQAEG